MSVSELFPLWKPRGAPCAECSPCCCSSLQSRWSLTALSLMQIAAAGPPTVSLLQSAVVMMIRRRRRRRMLNGNWCHDRRSARLNVQSEGGSRFWAALRSDADEVLWSFWITDIEINKTVKVMKMWVWSCLVGTEALVIWLISVLHWWKSGKVHLYKVLSVHLCASLFTSHQETLYFLLHYIYFKCIELELQFRFKVHFVVCGKKS